MSNWKNSIYEAVERVLALEKTHPILVDVGASGAPPVIWEPIARQSCYVGFDPDSRELHETSDGQFQSSTIVKEALASEPCGGKVKFYLTRSPYCSSTLPPDAKALSSYIFSDLFEIEREAEVSATTLNSVVAQLGLTAVDWIKLDTQGTDLRLYKSLADELRAHVMAVDVEPGLIDAYKGEDLFIETHRDLMREGFWLSNMSVKGAVRMSRAALSEVLKRQPALEESTLTGILRPAPGWCEARYLRSLEWLGAREPRERDYCLLWAFALLDEQIGFAFEVGLAFERFFPSDSRAPVLAAEALRLMNLMASKQVRKSRLAAAILHPLKRVLNRYS